MNAAPLTPRQAALLTVNLLPDDPATSSRVTGRIYRNSILRIGARVGLLEALWARG